VRKQTSAKSVYISKKSRQEQNWDNVQKKIGQTWTGEEEPKVKRKNYYWGEGGTGKGNTWKEKKPKLQRVDEQKKIPSLPGKGSIPLIEGEKRGG